MEHKHPSALPAPAAPEKPIRKTTAHGNEARTRHRQPAKGHCPTSLCPDTPVATPTYCITTADHEIYGVTRAQAAQLRKAIARFTAMEQVPTAFPVSHPDESDIHIDKCVTLSANTDRFFVNYSLHTFATDMRSMSASQMKQVANTMLRFLERHGDDTPGQSRPAANDEPPANGHHDLHVQSNRPDTPVCSDRHGHLPDSGHPARPDTHGCMDSPNTQTIAETPDHPHRLPVGEIAFSIRSDQRQARFHIAPTVSQYVNQDDGHEAEITYDFSVNAMISTDLTFAQLSAIGHRLDAFLASPVEA